MFGVRAFLGAVALGACLWLAPAHAGGKDGFVDLFNGKDLSGFKTILGGGKEDDGKVFSVKDGVINVAGSPNGYFYTEKSYKNYVLRFDWKFSKDGNSGLLVHITGKHNVWPKCVEVQGQQSDHGRIFGLGVKFDAMSKDKEGRAKMNEAQKKAIKKNDWNTTEIISQDGALTSKINGILIDTGKGDATEGQIGWQSEGVPLQFKNIEIKVLAGGPSTTPKADTPKKETPKKEAPKKVEQPKKEAPKTTEAPKKEPAKVDTAKADTAKAEPLAKPTKVEGKKSDPAQAAQSSEQEPQAEVYYPPQRRGLFPNLRARFRGVFR